MKMKTLSRLCAALTLLASSLLGSASRLAYASSCINRDTIISLNRNLSCPSVTYNKSAVGQWLVKIST